MDNKNQNCEVEKETSIRKPIENAIIIARATGNPTILKLNGANFAVYPDATLQHVIDVYLEIKDKMFETERRLRQKAK